MLKLIQKIDNDTVYSETEAPSFCEQYDVAVVGVGTAGAVAVMVSAGRGLKTLGIERLNAPGGTVTMTGICGYYFGGRGGAYESIDKRLDELSPLTAERAYNCPDIRKYNLECMIEESGASVRYESIVTGLYADGRKIVGIRLFSDGKETDVAVKMLIDATGDGDICDMAGCVMSFGGGKFNDISPFSIERAVLCGGVVHNFNCDNGKIDQRETKQYSQAILRAQGFYAKKIEGEIPLRLNSLPGLREGRTLCGEERLTIEDFFGEKFTDKPVIYAYSDLDKHGDDGAFDVDIFKKWHIMSNMGKINVTVPVPMGCLIAKEYDNLMVAGRCLSVDHEMQTCVRMNRDMQKLGEAAAVMASVAIEDGVALRDLDYDRVAPILRQSGCLSEENNKGYMFDSWSDPSFVRKVEWMDDERKTADALSTDKPAVAIWSCKRIGDKIKPMLYSWLESGDGYLAKHSALALAVMDDGAGLPVLRKMITDRDREQLKDMRRENKIHISMALCAVGMLKDVGSTDIIKAFISDKEEYKEYPETGGYRRGYYLALSGAVAALFDIADAHPEQKREISDFLEEHFADVGYIRKITTADENSAEYITAKEIYRNIGIWKDR